MKLIDWLIGLFEAKLRFHGPLLYLTCSWKRDKLIILRVELGLHGSFLHFENIFINILQSVNLIL